MGTEFSVTVDVHDYTGRLCRSRLGQLPHSEVLQSFLDHLESLGLSKTRALKYATSPCTIFKPLPFIS
ncbi:MAG: hypothetical protein QW424_05170 [Candidatus Bathyarchaeia archaeon]